MAAESAVSFALDKLGQILAAEVSLLIGVRGEVEWFKDQLGWMKSFLKDAYNKRRKGDERAKHWVREVRDTAYRVEDIIESYMMEIASRRQQPTRCCQVFNSIERYAHELKPRHKLGVEMKELKAKIHQISENRKNYGLVELGESTTNSTVDAVIQGRRIISPLYGDRVTIGFQDHKQKIVEELLDTKVARLFVKSIVGMGGIGKSTLAKMIFNTNELTVTFGTRAWVSVSRDFTIVDLLKTLIRQVTDCEAKALEESDLKRDIYRFLKGKRYFIVLDDIWSTAVWNMLKDVLPNDQNGSRVLVTTRMTEVALYVDPSIKAYHLPGLNEKDSWELFLKTAFPANYDEKEKNLVGLQDIAQRLVKRCEGLPLALVVLGGLMSTKTTNVEEWMKVEEGVDWGSTEDGKQCLEILALSYDGIVNPNMRSCFLYMGSFPKNSKILASQLIQLWIAEGFINHMENHEMEETARDYLDQLAQRCMIQVTRRWDRSIKECQIHDLMRDLCLREAREDGFLSVCNTYIELGNLGIDRNPIRLAVHISGKVEECSPLPYLRSLSIYDASEVTSEIFQGWKKLRVLQLERVEQSELKILLTEKKTANHLRYLGLRECDWLSELPPSIGDMFVNLQTLDVRNTEVREVPESLGKIKTLRHLYLPRNCKLPVDICLLTNLQTLEADAGGRWVERSLAMLSNIRNLSVWQLEVTHEEAFANALRKLKYLSHFEVKKSTSISAEIIRALSSHQYLFKLYVQGIMSQRHLPEGHEFPQNLTILELEETQLEKDPMAMLEHLPNLVSLVLGADAYFGSEMTCTSGGFLRLENLELRWLHELKHWTVENGAMPRLASLTIASCNQLMTLPNGMATLQNLTKLGVSSCFDIFWHWRSQLEEGGPQWWKVKHVKTITLGIYLSEGERQIIASPFDAFLKLRHLRRDV